MPLFRHGFRWFFFRQMALLKITPHDCRHDAISRQLPLRYAAAITLDYYFRHMTLLRCFAVIAATLCIRAPPLLPAATIATPLFIRHADV